MNQKIPTLDSLSKNLTFYMLMDWAFRIEKYVTWKRTDQNNVTVVLPPSIANLKFKVRDDIKKYGYSEDLMEYCKEKIKMVQGLDIWPQYYLDRYIYYSNHCEQCHESVHPKKEENRYWE